MNTYIPIISVIMPAYNEEKYLGEAIRSIINQTFTNWELIIVNDGSHDNTQTIINHYCKQDDRLKMISQMQKGVVQARIAGFKMACGKFIYFLDADDRSCPEALQRLYYAMETYPDVIAAFGASYRINEEGNFLNQNKPVIHDLQPLDIFPRIIERLFLAVGAVLIRSEAITDSDLHTSLEISEDWLMWCRLASKGQFIFIGEEPVLAYRQHNDNKTNIRVKEFIQYALKGLTSIFSDNLILKRLEPSEIDIHQKTGEFYIYLDWARMAYRNHDFFLTISFFWSAFRISVSRFVLLRHIISRFFDEVKYYFCTVR